MLEIGLQSSDTLVAGIIIYEHLTFSSKWVMWALVQESKRIETSLWPSADVNMNTSWYLSRIRLSLITTFIPLAYPFSCYGCRFVEEVGTFVLDSSPAVAQPEALPLGYDRQSRHLWFRFKQYVHWLLPSVMMPSVLDWNVAASSRHSKSELRCVDAAKARFSSSYALHEWLVNCMKILVETPPWSLAEGLSS